ncbi:succinate dehydrogenase, hydrophobic membrane anchor protein [Rickettsiales bacterium]|nr:succinate dehydrogenase, hydrophobic membrane anchor protein [Rickettsiales bacterium]
MLNIPEKILWIIQRLSAIFIFVFTIWFIISTSFVDLNNYYETLTWVKSKNNSILLFIFSLIVSLHSNLGLTVIIDDYIHEMRYKKIFFILKNSLVIFCISFSGICLYLI